MKKSFLHIACLLLVITTVAQNDSTKKSLYNDTYTPESVIDKKYGIIMYEKLNILLGGDTVRNKNGYAAIVRVSKLIVNCIKISIMFVA